MIQIGVTYTNLCFGESFFAIFLLSYPERISGTSGDIDRRLGVLSHKSVPSKVYIYKNILFCIDLFPN